MDWIRVLRRILATAVAALALLPHFAIPNLAMAKQDDLSFLRVILTAADLREDWFSDGFLRNVPMRRIGEVMHDLRSRYGPVRSVSGGSGKYSALTRSHRIPVRFSRDDDGKVVGLLFGVAILVDQDLQVILGRINRLPGEIAYLALRGDEVAGARSEDGPLAVGSAFKLAVLAALRAKIDAGKATWRDVVTLQPHHISLPSGILQDMPVGAPLTVHSLAALMIARSDNTATDALIDYVGRVEVEEVAEIAPLLTTREFFQLKADQAVYASYASADLGQRRAILDSLQGRPLPSAGRVLGQFRRHAEWRLSSRKLCALMKRVADLEIMGVNPGPLERADWRSLAYKGGSETGVLNLTAQVVDDAGVSICVSVTWNNSSAVDENRLFELFGSLMNALAQKG